MARHVEAFDKTILYKNKLHKLKTIICCPLIHYYYLAY